MTEEQMMLSGEEFGIKIGRTRLAIVSAYIKELRKENYSKFIEYLPIICPSFIVPIELSSKNTDNDFAVAFSKGIDTRLNKM